MGLSGGLADNGIGTTSSAGPQGSTGPTGATGVSGVNAADAIWQGTWVVGTTYRASQIVFDAGHTYISRAGGNVGNQPSTDMGVNWVQLG